MKTVDYIEEDDAVEQTGIFALQVDSSGPMEAWDKDIRLAPLF